MEPITISPRYMALNSGQEAFQYFYECLLGLMAQQELIKGELDSFYRKNQSHLSTIIHTFNRHYCTEIGSTNRFHQLTGEITPVFLNLGLYKDKPEYNIHRLLGIHLDCSDDNPRADRIYLIFDHPAYSEPEDGETESESDLPSITQAYTFALSLEVFTKTYYNEQLYQCIPADYIELDIRYNATTGNYFYDYAATDELVSIQYHWALPPFYSHLHIKSVFGSNTLSCIDTHGIYKLLGNSRYSGFTWAVNTYYIAPNRYTRLVKPEYETSIILSNNAECMRLLTLLFGCNSMLYVFANFKQHRYVPSLYFKLTKGDTSYMKTDGEKTILYYAVGNKIGLTETPFTHPGLVPIDDPDVTTLEDSYIEMYHRYN